MKVIFICLGNSCRSIMAEALARHFHGDCLAPASAGLHPLGYVARETLQVLAEIGVPTQGLRSKGLNELALPEYALIINLSDHPLAGVVPAPLAGRVLNRYVIDPFGADLSAYRRTRDAIRRLLSLEISSFPTS